MSGTAAIKRPPQGDLPNPTKRVKPLSELESRINHFNEIIKNIGFPSSQSPEYGKALFTYVSSNQAAQETWKDLFAALSLTNKELLFKEGKSVTLPLCLWNAHSSYFFHLFTLEMKQTPLEDMEVEDLESFKNCLNACNSVSILNATNWQGLFGLAQKYQVLWLVSDCQDFLCENLSQFSEEDQQKLVCFAAEFSLSQLLQTCLRHFVRNNIEVKNLDLLKEMRELAHQLALADLKLYLSDTLRDKLWVSSSNFFSLQLESHEVESYKEEIKECISSKSLWHSPQITFIVEEGCLQADTLAFLLDKNSTLIGPDLVTDAQGIQVITEMMGNNGELKLLDIYGATFPNTSLGDETLAYFLSILKTHFSLNALLLGNCLFGERSASALMEFLNNNPHISTLTLSNSNLEEEMILALQKGCAANTALTHLSLIDCYIGGEASLSDFFTSLEKNKTLVSLNVGNPYNSDVEEDNPIPMLLEMLKKNRVLKKLTIDSLEDFDILEILKVVTSEESILEQITFLNCKLTKVETIQSLAENAMKKSTQIVFESCEMGKEVCTAFLQHENPPHSISFLNNIPILVLSSAETESDED